MTAASTIEFMTTAKKITIMAAAAIALTIPTLTQWRNVKKLRTENDALRAENRQVRNDQRVLAERLKDSGNLLTQLQRDAAELPTLRGEVASLRQHPGTPRELRPPLAEPGNDPSDEPWVLPYPHLNPKEPSREGLAALLSHPSLMLAPRQRALSVRVACACAAIAEALPRRQVALFGGGTLW